LPIHDVEYTGGEERRNKTGQANRHRLPAFLDLTQQATPNRPINNQEEHQPKETLKQEQVEKGTIDKQALATSTVMNTYGVLARNASKNGIGVFGLASSLTGNTYGVYGRVDSPSGIAGMFMTSATTGTVLAANNSVKRIFRLDAAGNLFAAGTLNPNGADYAELVASAGNRNDYEPGDVLVIDEFADRHVTRSYEPYSTNVAGVFSTKPGILGSVHEMSQASDEEIPVAMVGIVPCKVSAENGSIRRGDLLVTSSTLGYAMRATDRSQFAGAILGKAMEPLDKGLGLIQILVSPQ